MSDKIRELLNRIIPRLDAGGPNPIDPELHHCEWALYQERERIHAEFEAALAQEGAPVAVPDGWKPEVVQGPRVSVFYGGNRDEHLNRPVILLYADEYEKLLSMLAAPAAPVAVGQEPGIFGLVYWIDEQPVIQLVGDPHIADGMAVYAAPPAAEQPDAQLGSVQVMCQMLEEREWAEHVGVGEIGKRLEMAITKLHNELQQANNLADQWAEKNAALAAQLENNKLALDEWFAKTDWVRNAVQDGRLPASYLGQHRADIMTSEVIRQRDALHSIFRDPNTDGRSRDIARAALVGKP